MNEQVATGARYGSVVRLLEGCYGKSLSVLAGMPLEFFLATRQRLLIKYSSPVVDDVECLYVCSSGCIL